MEALFWITMGVGGLWVVMFVSSLLELRQIPQIRPARGASHAPLPRVSIIVPARNEEANIIPCLESLLAQDHADIEIIVVDDNSTDGTADLVSRMARQDYRVRLVRITELPEGWTGKCNAMHQGVTAGKPRGEWILFTDADTTHSAQSISAPLQAGLNRKVDLVSIIPHLQAESFWERLMQPTVAALISLFHKPARINDPDRPDAFANGQYILIRKEAYFRAGGYEAIRGKVLEDVELARIVAASGGRIFLALGRDLFSTRMYTDLRSLMQGWAKNFYMILESRLPKVLTAGFTALLMSLWPAVFGLGALVALMFDLGPWSTGRLWAAVGVYALVTSFQAVLRGLNRWYPKYTLLAPVANLMAVYMIVQSARAHRRGKGVTWKGRVIFDDKGGPP
jgi:chlorobactene glucosyltransferase